MPGMNIGYFASGLGTGMALGQEMRLKETRESREAKKFGTEQATREIDLERKQKEQPVIDKELQVRGARADYDLTEQGFKTRMQDFEQKTREMLAQQQQNQAKVGVGASAAAVANQPDQLAVEREKLNNDVLQASLRQTANIYRIAKLGNMDAARDMFNNSMLVEPGSKAKSVKFDEVDAPGKDGTTQKVKVLSIEGEDGKVRQVPASQLDALEQQFGATYQKVGNAIVRINRDGTTTPVYEATEAGANPETGDLYYQKGPKAGQVATPAAAGGLPKPGTKPAARMDDAVTKGRTVIDKYFGISEFSRLDDKSQPAYNSAVARMGALVRGGTDPEKAANQALLEAKDGRLNPDGTPKGQAAPAPGAPAAPGAGGGNAGGYAGPTPWRR